ncbi:hypothetical protein Cgig2_016920 [Carnegiea gigantea]|uniref:Uncharacterized protein n=1 Tax=Carnegiea gigantea TaxID=171969 RepID=A0A9Q1GSP8_9CARY|nr:hypothetical protein Cgig2_016920 [Carnegiea gigantea]
MMHKDKLISNNWVEFLECMRITGRDPDKLTLVRKRIQNVVKELKELDSGTSENKISKLESFIGLSVLERIDILPPKQCHTKGSGKHLKGGKRNQWNNNNKDKDFVKLVDNKVTMTVVIVLQSFLLNLRLVSLVEEQSKLQNLDNVDRAHGGFQEAELSKSHKWDGDEYQNGLLLVTYNRALAVN